MNCETCNKQFSSKFNLNRHKNKRNKCGVPPPEHNCQFCEKKLSSKHALSRHLGICKKKVIQTAQVNTINGGNNNLHTGTGNIINPVINITFNNVDFTSFMTKDKIKEVFEKHFTINILLGAQESLADFTVDNFLSGSDKPYYLCSDKSRKSFCYYDNQVKKKDPQAEKLRSLILNHGMKTISSKYNSYKKISNKIPPTLDTAFNDIVNLKSNGKKYINKLSKKLPHTVNERYDENFEIEEELEDDLEEDIEDNLNLLDDVNFDDNEFEIGGVPIRKLKRFKLRFLETGEKLVPKDFTNTL